MNLFIIGAIVVAVILILLVVVGVARWRKEEKRLVAKDKDEYLDLCRKADLAEQGDVAAQKAIAHYYSTTEEFSAPVSLQYIWLAKHFDNPELAKRVQSIVALFRDRLEYERNASLAKNAKRSWENAGDNRSYYKAARQIALCFQGRREGVVRRLADEFGMTLAEAIQHLIRLQRALYDADRGTIQTGEDDDIGTALCSLRNLILESRRTEPSDSWLRNQGLPKLSSPKGWNELVAKHIHNPSLGWFVDISRDLAAGQLRLKAEAALLDEDILEVKMALAYCNYSPRYREELGDVLTDKLGLFVETWSRSAQTQPEVDTPA